MHYQRTGAGRMAGFTLIELLIVIAILGALAAVLLPNILGVSDAAKETATRTTMLRLNDACRTFERGDRGYYPPDNFQSPEAAVKVAWKGDNGQNSGIESLVAFVSQSKNDGTELSDLGSQITNTDKDDHGAELPMLHTKERKEVADAWGTPFAYFTKFGMDKPQSVVSAEDPTPMPVSAKRRADGTFHGADKFQILSAGKDKTFGTDDDLVWPEN